MTVRCDRSSHIRTSTVAGLTLYSGRHARGKPVGLVAVVLAGAITSGCGASGDGSTSAQSMTSQGRPKVPASESEIQPVPEPKPVPGQVWSRHFVATSIKEGGEKQPPIAHSGDVGVSFTRWRGGGRWIGWEANCNEYGARVRIKASKLKLGAFELTAKGCPPKLTREDAWLARFFGADPRWRLHGAHLTLSSGNESIALEELKDKSRKGYPSNRP